jgi:hemerythrin
MEWNDRLSVGIPSIDIEHRRLVGMLNELFDSAQNGKGKETLGKILDGLVTYTATHFANEERYFAQHAYPDSKAHKAEHDALAKSVIDVQKRYRAGASAALSMEVLNFLKNWLSKHIQGSDKKYAPYLTARGVR